MMTRWTLAALLLALPLSAQTPAVSDGEAMFYKAYWLQKSERRFAESLVLYDQFLQLAPRHALARQAATNRLELLTQLGDLAAARTFAKQYEALLGKVAIGSPAGAEQQPGSGEAGDEGAPRGGRARGGRGSRQGRGGNRQEELATAEKALEEAKAAGDDDRVAELTQRVERLQGGGREGGNRGRGRGRGDRGGRGGSMRVFMGDTKVADMSDEQRTQLREGLANMGPMMERMRERMSEEQVKALDSSIKALEKALDDDQVEAAQKALDKLRESMPWRRRGGGGGLR